MITLFGNLEWGDERGLQQWLAAHDLKHQALAQASARSGSALPAFLLSVEIDDSWLQTHWQQHHQLAQLLTPDTDSSSYDLLNDPMESEENFYDWQDIHDLLHQRLDQALGITG